ncbi:protein male-specific lethal-3 [Drosophila ficusphila]|uniref:protein male-specific lethal-3 n=1 Tax=Drosophila ficusphila TaxID=30025 RepID=UPI0007E62FE7|nr:protein male-specific lethal-3 [Drosophila ficusphila]
MTEYNDEPLLFHKGEIVLCYEPDKSKARVLYTSKVINVFERRNEHGMRYYDYKIHFQGWRPSYDRSVRGSVLLKDTEENRQLQRELAEAAQLQIRGDYSYKGTPDKPPAKKKRGPKGAPVEEPLVDPLDTGNLTAEPEMPLSHRATGHRAPARDNKRKGKAAEGKGTRGRPSEAAQHNEIVDPERFLHQEERVIMRVSERLRELIEYDRNMIKKLGNQHALPARVPIVTIMENFIKQRAVELAIGIKQDSARARTTNSRNLKLKWEYDRVMSIVCMLKEVVDGLRVYFEFHMEDHLLYKEEKEYIQNYLTDENMKNCSLILNKSYDFINPSGDTDLVSLDGTPVGGGGGKSNGQIEGGILGSTEYEKQLQKCLLYIVTCSGKNTAQAYERSSPYTAAYKLPFEMRDFLHETFSWRLLSAESPPERSMIFGAPHLARLMIKMPMFLNASPISNRKLEDLLPHLDSFTNYLENHREWFDKDNYVKPTAAPQEHLQRELLNSLDGIAA